MDAGEAMFKTRAKRRARRSQPCSALRWARRPLQSLGRGAWASPMAWSGRTARQGLGGRLPHHLVGKGSKTLRLGGLVGGRDGRPGSGRELWSCSGGAERDGKQNG